MFDLLTYKECLLKVPIKIKVERDFMVLKINTRGKLFSKVEKGASGVITERIPFEYFEGCEIFVYKNWFSVTYYVFFFPHAKHTDELPFIVRIYGNPLLAKVIKVNIFSFSATNPYDIRNALSTLIRAAQERKKWEKIYKSSPNYVR